MPEAMFHLYVLGRLLLFSLTAAVMVLVINNGSRAAVSKVWRYLLSISGRSSSISSLRLKVTVPNMFVENGKATRNVKPSCAK